MNRNQGCESFVRNRRLVLYSCAVLMMVFYNPEPLFADKILPDSLIYSIHPSAAYADSGLSRLLESYIKIEFSRRGIELIKIEDGSSRENRKLPLLYDSPAVMIFNISEAGDQITVSADLYPEKSSDIVFSISRTVPVDLAVDSMISELIEELIDNSFDYISVEAPMATELEEAVEIPEPEMSGQQEALELPVPELPQAEYEEIAESEPVEADAADRMLPIRISSGLAPFIAAGKVNYYFNFGFLVTLQGGYLFQTPAGNFEAGGITGVLIFEADGIEGESRNLLFPLAASGRWLNVFSEKFSINVSLSAGIALMHMRMNEDAGLNKLNAFVSTGGGGSIHFSPDIGMTIEGTYMLFFEQYYPIMGIVPQICFDYRF